MSITQSFDAFQQELLKPRKIIVCLNHLACDRTDCTERSWERTEVLRSIPDPLCVCCSRRAVTCISKRLPHSADRIPIPIPIRFVGRPLGVVLR